MEKDNMENEHPGKRWNLQPLEKDRKTTTGKCTTWKMHDMENAQHGKCTTWKMKENAHPR